MGITEYVASRHTFGILICVIHDGVNVGALALARRLHAAAPMICGLYAHATADPLVVSDTLFARVSLQYRMILYVCASDKKTSTPLLYLSGPREAIAIVRAAFAPAETTAVTYTDPALRIAVAEPGLDDASIRNQIADILVGALSRLANSTGR
jgi:hypothetical protein